MKGCHCCKTVPKSQDTFTGRKRGRLAPQVSEHDLEQVIGAGELQDPETERLADIEGQDLFR